MLTILNFDSLLSADSLKKGKDYFIGGCVENLEQVDSIWTADVEGTEVYEVEICTNGNSELLNTDCDCPHDATYCKHIVAVLYAIRNEILEKSISTKVKSEEDIFSGLLMKVTQLEYQAFTKEYSKKNKDFKTAFELFFAEKDERIDIAQKYKKIAESLINKHSYRGFLDYKGSVNFAKEIGGLLRNAGSIIQKNNLVDAFLICKTVLPTILETVEYCDDSNGAIGGTIDELIGLIADIASKPEAAIDLKVQIFEYLESQSTNSIYFDYGDFGYDMVKILQKLAVQLNYEEAYINCLDRLILKSKEDSYSVNFFIKSKIDFYQQIGKPELAFSLVENNMEIVDIRERIVKESMEAKDFSKAKRLIDEGVEIAIKKNHPGTVSQWLKHLLEIAYLENDLTNIRQLCKRFAFDRGVDLIYYVKWKETFSKEEWATEIENYIASIIKIRTTDWENKKGMWHTNHPNLLNDLALIYIEENYFDRLIELVRLDNNLESTMAYQKFLKKDYSKELINCFIPQLRTSAERANDRGSYAHLVRNMKEIIKEIPSSSRDILALAEELKLKYSIKPRRPAMLEELEKIFK